MKNSIRLLLKTGEFKYFKLIFVIMFKNDSIVIWGALCYINTIVLMFLCNFSKMYLEELDPDLKVGPWTEEEDKCLLFLHKLFYQVYSSFIYYSTRFTLPSYTILPGLLFLHNLFY